VVGGWDEYFFVWFWSEMHDYLALFLVGWGGFFCLLDLPDGRVKW